MKRHIEKDLRKWKEQQGRMPLLLRGARQVGKTYIVEKFGREEFASFVSINFELQPEVAPLFDQLEPHKLLENLSTFLGVTIRPGETLLFLDEIQECPRAIMALRYFKEQIPELHVIGAGSLLEFTLRQPDFRMPVGRVQFMHLHPLSFYEFLEATENEGFLQQVRQLELRETLPDVIHEKGLRLVREYLALGGMPAVVAHYLNTRSLEEAQQIQTALLATYRGDFGKYAKQSQHEHLQMLFDRAPGLVGEWFKYSKVEPEVRSREIKGALTNLVDAGLIHLVHATSGAGIPMEATMNEKKFKLLFLDIGLLKRALRLELQLIFNEDLMLLNQGALIEQFVGQELLTYANTYDPKRLFFWVREQKSSSAEVDYLTTVGSQIVPVEVKAGATGRLKSLKLFMKERDSVLGVRISPNPMGLEENILSIPLYMIGELSRLVKSIAASRRGPS